MAYDYPISRRRNHLTLGHPHLWVRYGVWHCSSAGVKATGLDARNAYYNWQRGEKNRANKLAIRKLNEKYRKR